MNEYNNLELYLISSCVQVKSTHANKLLPFMFH